MTILNIINENIQPVGVGGHYQRVINEIMIDHGIPPLGNGANPIVPANASRRQVIQHAEYFLGEGRDERPHYRYRRYLDLLKNFNTSASREAVVDMGCGAGVFSWVFLDWAVLNGQDYTGQDYTDVDLYAFDHSPEMLWLAQEVRNRQLPQFPDYPSLRCSERVTDLCNQLTENHQSGTDYTITLGHVLVQAHTPSAIESFTRIVVHVLSLLEIGHNCALIAADARRQTAEFAIGWNALLASLREANVEVEERNLNSPRVNNAGDAKIAFLHRTS